MNIQVEINQKSIDDINHIENVLEELYQQLLYMKYEVGHEMNPYPISLHGEYDDPKNKNGVFLQSDVPIPDAELPVVFFALGESKENNSLPKPANHRAETSTILVNALIEKDVNNSLLKPATDMQTAIRMLVKGNQDLGNTISKEQAKVKSETIVDGMTIKVFEPSTKQVRLARSLPFRPRSRSQVSKRLMLVFHIEVDYIYSML